MKQPAIFILLLLGVIRVYCQCSSLRQQRDITFNTNRDCAPVTVTDFTISYYFNTPQNPADIVIRFDWNDPGNNFDLVSFGDPAFDADSTNTKFTATSTFTYPENDDCEFEPVATISVNGENCETSTQRQIVVSWARDDEFGGVMAVDPGVFEVCYGNAIVNAIFEDNSTFNCNINVEPDNPNRVQRYTQFVYGTGHNPLNSIRNLTLTDGGGGTVPLTDGAANLSNTYTRGGVTGAYFGPVEHIPDPADGPTLISFPMNAPANLANAVGSRFEITLFNWNVCNPYNGNAANPNYADAATTTAYIEIISAPSALFQTRLGDASGTIQDVFCLGDDIYFQNQTSGATDYYWEFFNDTTGSDLIGSSTATNPTFSFDAIGDKLVRLMATNNDAQGNCEVVYERTLTISPAAIAGIGIMDTTFTSELIPEFCYDGNEITLGLQDRTQSIATDTEWRWEFFDDQGNLVESIPPGVGIYGPQYTNFIRSFDAPGIFPIRLLARNAISGCETMAEDTIVIYDTPNAFFEAAAVCAGNATSFTEISDSISSIPTLINGDHISLYEWDFSFSGSFQPELVLSSSQDFSFNLDGNDVISGQEPDTSVPGTYTVALRVTSGGGNCSDIYTTSVQVNPLPVPLLISDYMAPICPGDSLNFFNESNLLIADYQIVIADYLSRDSASFMTPDSTITFTNNSDSIKVYSVLLVGENEFGCQAQSDPILIEVLPASISDFYDSNYSTAASNCSPWNSVLYVSDATLSLDADQYIWTIYDETGVVEGYPISKESGDADFHSLDYQLINDLPSNQLYTITLEVYKEGVCISPSTHDFIINPKPRSTWDMQLIDSCEFVSIKLEADQQGLPRYEWTFDPQPDVQSGSGPEIELTYQRPGLADEDLEVDISLVTENLARCAGDTIFTSVTIAKKTAPVLAFFTVLEDTIMQPDSLIYITNESSSGTSYIWTFGDGATDTSEQPQSHAYSEPGIYEISLLASDEFCRDSHDVSVLVEPTAPIIDFSADKRIGCSPLQVAFTNLSSYADPETFFWEFGDGQSSTAESPTYTYTREGKYTVRLYGENRVGEGSELIREEYIEVFPRPLADFAVNPEVAYIPDQDVFFRNKSKNADTYRWDFGDGMGSTEENPVHTYSSEGTYTVMLIATSADFCSDTLRIPAALLAKEGGQVRSPNAFSPSPRGEGPITREPINDIFYPRVQGAEKFRMLIYNKWGELLFESRNQNMGWDGHYKGRLLPADVYVYRLELKYSDGREAVKVGDVTLVR